MQECWMRTFIKIASLDGVINQSEHRETDWMLADWFLIYIQNSVLLQTSRIINGWLQFLICFALLSNKAIIFLKDKTKIKKTYRFLGFLLSLINSGLLQTSTMKIQKICMYYTLYHCKAANSDRDAELRNGIINQDNSRF